MLCSRVLWHTLWAPCRGIKCEKKEPIYRRVACVLVFLNILDEAASCAGRHPQGMLFRKSWISSACVRVHICALCHRTSFGVLQLRVLGIPQKSGGMNPVLVRKRGAGWSSDILFKCISCPPLNLLFGEVPKSLSSFPSVSWNWTEHSVKKKELQWHPERVLQCSQHLLNV